MADAGAERMRTVSLTINGRALTRAAPVRMHLADFLRREAGLTGTHLGCEHGVCGACTVLVDGVTARGCLLLAVQAEGCDVRTVEGVAPGAALHPLQQSFWDLHGLQCGYCTPGILMTLVELLRDEPRPTETAVREALSGHLCRCTGYQNIVAAALAAADAMARQDP